MNCRDASFQSQRMALVLPLFLVVLMFMTPAPPAQAQSFTDVSAAPLNDGGNGYGVAWGDYDNDGDLDLYLVNAGSANKLFRNNGNGTFTDVAVSAGVNNIAGGRCAVWGDYDNDGYLDVYLVNFGSANKLYRNNGDGTFADVAVNAGVADNGNGAAAAWADYDNDGYIDLYVSKENQPNKLLHNDGDGTFSDVTPPALADAGQSEGVAWGDYDNDGDQDLYVANLGTANKLFHNDGLGSFTDISAPPLNDAFNSTGVAWGDFDNDGDLDLFLVNAQTGTDKLFQNNGDGSFADVSNQLPPGDSGNGRSVAWGDYDNDGDLDLYVTNFGQANKLFRNDNGTFVDATTGTPLGDTSNSRGAAWGDFDGDGDLDLYLVNSSAANKLFRNDQPAGNHWLEVKLQGTVSNRSGIGARVTVVAGGVSRMQETSGGSGFLSQNSLPVEFGLGAATTIDSVIVNWPSGIRRSVRPAVNVIATVTEPSSFALNVGVAGNGTVTKSPNQPNYAYRSSVELAATALVGQSFVNWGGDESGTSNPLTVTMNANKNIIANFTSSLNVTVSGIGTVTKNPDLAAYMPGSTVQLTATPGAGYAFAGWSGDASGVTNPLSIVMNGNRAITASFGVVNQGVDLAWNQCILDGGRPTRSFLCNSNSGASNLYGSFHPGVDLYDVTNVNAELIIKSADDTLPSWWQFANPGACRTSWLTTISDLTGVACDDWSAATATTALTYTIGYLAPNRARVIVQSFVPTSSPVHLLSSKEYVAFILRILNLKTTGSGACSGCLSGATIKLMQLTVGTSDGSTFRLSGPTDGLSSDQVTWQSGGGAITDVPDGVSGALLPASAWPNPFARRVSIAFSLPRATPVRMEVFDIGGRRLRATSFAHMDVGRHSLEWDGRTDDGLAQGNGIYLLRVTGAGFSASRTVVHMN